MWTWHTFCSTFCIYRRVRDAWNGAVCFSCDSQSKHLLGCPSHSSPAGWDASHAKHLVLFLWNNIGFCVGLLPPCDDQASLLFKGYPQFCNVSILFLFANAYTMIPSMRIRTAVTDVVINGVGILHSTKVKITRIRECKAVHGSIYAGIPSLNS